MSFFTLDDQPKVPRLWPEVPIMADDYGGWKTFGQFEAPNGLAQTQNHTESKMSQLSRDQAEKLAKLNKLMDQSKELKGLTLYRFDLLRFESFGCGKKP